MSWYVPPCSSSGHQSVWITIFLGQIDAPDSTTELDGSVSGSVELEDEDEPELLHATRPALIVKQIRRDIFLSTFDLLKSGGNHKGT
jgi:hypothetical protein